MYQLPAWYVNSVFPQVPQGMEGRGGEGRVTHTGPIVSPWYTAYLTASMAYKGSRSRLLLMSPSFPGQTACE